MTTLTKAPKENKPVHGSCRWAYRAPADLSAQARRLGVLEINAQLYAVSLIAGGIELKKNDADGTTYHVCTSSPYGWTCDCPDAEFRPRPGGCKHVAALRAALAAIGVEPLPAAPTIPAATTRSPVDLDDF